MWTDAFQKGCDPSKNHSRNDTPRPRRSLSQNLGVVLCQMSQNNADAAAVALGRSGGGARAGASRVHVRHLPPRAPPTGCATATAWSAAAGRASPHADVHRPGRCTSRTGARLGAGKRRSPGLLAGQGGPGRDRLLKLSGGGRDRLRNSFCTPRTKPWLVDLIE